MITNDLTFDLMKCLNFLKKNTLRTSFLNILYYVEGTEFLLRCETFVF